VPLRVARADHQGGAPCGAGGRAVSALPAALAAHPQLDTWVRIDAADTITVFTGKVELGQGIASALARVAAEELDVAFERIRVHTADTAHPLDERITAGSLSMTDSGSALRQAAAEVRALLLERAAAVLDSPPAALAVYDGTVVEPGGARHVSYWELAGGRALERLASGAAQPKASAEHRIVGSGERNRSDLRGIVTGTTRFVTDLRRDDMLHGRVVRPPSPAATLASLDEGPARALPGVVAVVRNGSFVAVAAEREQQAVRAADVLRECARWAQRATLPSMATLAQWLREQPGEAYLVENGTPAGAASERDDTAVAWTLSAAYTRPYLMHGSIGPSAAMALWQDGSLEVWTHSQGVHVLREALAAALALAAERIRVRHVVGPGCYGHNGADDAAFDAALVAMATPGRPLLLTWSREDEHRWEPYGAPALVELRARLDEDGAIAQWHHDAWGTTHVARPMVAGTPNLLAGAHLDPPLRTAVPAPMLGREVGIHRNASPIYRIPAQRIVKHFVAASPLRTSSLRSLGAFANVFAIESFIDELAASAGVTPLEFRRRHLDDSRALAVLEAAAASAGWGGGASREPGRGAGIALARYKNSAAYAAVVVRARVEDASAVVALERIVIAADCGEVVDPSGAVNQLEGGALQSASWTLKEQVAFDSTAVTSVDWDSYPILRFSEVPPVEVTLLDRPGLPFLGVGEAAQGPTAAAIANAVADAVGLRLRELPFTPERVRAAALRA
jgi:nicotinate dehydrogenase subunit B